MNIESKLVRSKPTWLSETFTCQWKFIIFSYWIFLDNMSMTSLTLRSINVLKENQIRSDHSWFLLITFSTLDRETYYNSYFTARLGQLINMSKCLTAFNNSCNSAPWKQQSWTMTNVLSSGEAITSASARLSFRR